MGRATDKRKIRFDYAGNMVFPGFAIKNEQGDLLCDVNSQQPLQFLTRADAQQFVEKYPELTRSTRIVGYTFLIPEGADDE